MPGKTVLVTGGAGYIGSHAVISLVEESYNVVILDDLSTGFKELVHQAAYFVEGNVGDPEILDQVFSHYKIDCVMHFAGSIVVPESVKDPLKYYHNNTVNTLTLIEKCIQYRINHFIFSSTAAVYGIPLEIPVDESCITNPINPYGTSKRTVELILQDTAHAYPDFKYVALRYFNVAGADPSGRSGQLSPNATHLIKTASQLAVGRRDVMSIFGSDYATKDGTCVRDYIHVSDLAKAHVDTLKYLQSGGQSNIFNVGYGQGYSVREVLDMTQNIVGRQLNIQEASRRAGDPPALIAKAEKICSQTGWRPQYNDLYFIIETALKWEEKLINHEAYRSDIKYS